VDCHATRLYGRLTDSFPTRKPVDFKEVLKH
jgi:hypothetical protein